MSKHAYRTSRHLLLEHYPTEVLLMTAMQSGTAVEVGRLAAMFPELYAEVVARTESADDSAPGDPVPASQKPARRVPRRR